MSCSCGRSRKGFAGKAEHLLTFVKLFFDNDQDDFVQRSWIDVNDHRFTETSIKTKLKSGQAVNSSEFRRR